VNEEKEKMEMGDIHGTLCLWTKERFISLKALIPLLSNNCVKPKKRRKKCDQF